MSNILASNENDAFLADLPQKDAGLAADLKDIIAVSENTVLK